MPKRRILLGFTLIELVVSMSVLFILISVGIPNMIEVIDKNRIKATVERMAGDLQYARTESIKRNKEVSVTITTTNATDWCYGLSETPNCDCYETNPGAANACALSIAGSNKLKVAASTEFQDISLTSESFSGSMTTFDPVRGTTNSGQVRATALK